MPIAFDTSQDWFHDSPSNSVRDVVTSAQIAKLIPGSSPNVQESNGRLAAAAPKMRNGMVLMLDAMEHAGVKPELCADVRAFLEGLNPLP